jgi:hypothetical protein
LRSTNWTPKRKRGGRVNDSAYTLKLMTAWGDVQSQRLSDPVIDVCCAYMGMTLEET